MNFNQIHKLDADHSAVQKYKKAKKLFLSHNYLYTLEGIEMFTNLTHLSISHNKIQDIEELSRIKSVNKLECLAVKGNFIDRHPDYKSLIVQFYPKLKELDNLQINEAIRQQIKDGC